MFRKLLHSLTPTFAIRILAGVVGRSVNRSCYLHDQSAADAAGSGPREFWVRRQAVVVVVLSAALAIHGNTVSAQNTTAAVVSREYERDGARIQVTAAPATLGLSDDVELTVTVAHDPRVTVEFPDPALLWAEVDSPVRLLEQRAPLQESAGERVVQRRVYRLAPTRAGPLSIEGLLVGLVDGRQGTEAATEIVEIEPLAVTVTTVLTAEPSLALLQPAAPPVGLSPSQANRWLTLLLVIVGVVAVLFMVWRRRRHLRASVPCISPREQAERALTALLQSDLAQRDVKAFYVELTGIVRRYIEQTKGVRAPEQTTEEFLREVTTTAVFADEQRLRLQEFLEVADLVKYAGVRPRTEDISDSITRAKAFIELESREALA